MSYCFTSLLLAVAICLATAHGKTLPLNAKPNVTSLNVQRKIATTAAASVENLHNLNKTKDERRTSSAVQDWSLVCQQLCGAALGGAACIPHCGNVSQTSLKVQAANADTLMASKQHFICPQLCELQLGDDVCTCSKWNVPSKLRATNEPKNVCAIFCEAAHVTLAGCSSCGQKEKSQGKENQAIKTFNEAVKRVNVTTTAATLRAETPNWNHLCAALCKTGDGGSLCNCDLSPFMV